MTVSYGSVCSGIEAATVAWHPLGMRAAWYAEIEAFPSAVLAHRYPETANLGDMTRLAALVLAGKIEAPDVLVGGTPCQAFSVAGMREGLADPRGALTIKYVELADAIDHVRVQRGLPESIDVWENVPGVLSDKGNAFGCFLGALVGESEELQPPGKRWADAGCVYGPRRAVAWRILDAQYFGLAQRRRRVFVVASARSDFDPASVLFEREGLRRDHPPSRGETPNVAGTLTGGARKHGGYSTDDLPCVAAPLTTNQYGDHESRESLLVFGGGANCQATDVSTALSAHPGGTRMDAETETFVVHGTQDPDVTQGLAHALGRNQGQENAVLAFSCKDHGADVGHIAPTLRAMGHGESHANAGGQVAVAYPLLEVGKRTGASTNDPRAGIGIGNPADPMFTLQAGAQHGVCVTGDIAHTLKAEGFDASEDGTGRGQPMVPAESGVRRLTPRECERLQGFPDDHTLIPWRGRPASECPDGPRYKAIGNSKAVPVVRWIGRRLLAALP
ncbi:DNA cytosine methyltransferase [Pseudomonas oryzihabitans]|uniref:DNA cytosine methyltransferase n=1 Tax=Pseudomonas oryzihabitans TaxID=47885 RepID=UPI0011222686|nr:DNA cytosine methyltransferase [Pseudomonas psychrotolerans]QDD91898.1 cytosine methyltransferase [Pseudomonas psychrotolerans]QDD91954.1 cytosine methyltransferase [Pseudomonas psychrotolerans]